MAKQQGRKPPKRKPARPRIDDDLAELATMLDERRLDSNAEGWFSVPWRNGWNAITLAHATWVALSNMSPADAPASLDISYWISVQRADAEVYWRAGDALVELGSGAPLLRAALRCIQVLISRSDGGGEVYNAILRPAFEALIPDEIAVYVEDARRIDALGPPETNEASVYARRKKGFEIAWRRGLYRAAYAL